jgi:hypothetical protein
MRVVLVGVAGVVLTSCGNVTRSPTVVVVGGATITKSAVQHWMTALSLSDARERSPHIDESPRQQALSFLITSHWLVDEARHRGLGVTAGEVGRALRAQEGAYATHSEFTDFLKATRRTVADLWFELEAELAFIALHRALERKQADPRREARAEFLAEWISRWKAQTDCRAGYVVDGCRQHLGPVAIEYPISADF